MEKKIIKYLNERKVNKMGGLRYAYWKRIIKYKLNERDYIIRKIFIKLLRKNYFREIRPRIYRYGEDLRDISIIIFD